MRIAITHGDTNGIGYELIYKTFSEPDLLELLTPIIYGSPKSAAYHRNLIGTEVNFTIIKTANEAQDGKLNLLTTFDEEVKAEIGKATKESNEAAVKALERAINDYNEGLVDALVTAPMTTEKLDNNEFPFATQSEYIARYFTSEVKPLEIITDKGLRMAYATGKIPLAEVNSTLTTELLTERIKTFGDTLRRDFRISVPRIAILAVNPANDKGTFGREEEEIIRPAISQANEKTPIAFGPYQADNFFSNHQYEAFDGIMAMHYEQALLPFNIIATDDGVCLTAGLPIVHTYTTRDCNFAAAGKGTTDETAFRNAIYLAIDIARNRTDYDKPFENPLPKLYHERKEDNGRPRNQQ